MMAKNNAKTVSSLFNDAKQHLRNKMDIALNQYSKAISIERAEGEARSSSTNMLNRELQEIRNAYEHLEAIRQLNATYPRNKKQQEARSNQ